MENGFNFMEDGKKPEGRFRYLNYESVLVLGNLDWRWVSGNAEVLAEFADLCVGPDWRRVSGQPAGVKSACFFQSHFARGEGFFRDRRLLPAEVRAGDWRWGKHGVAAARRHGKRCGSGAGLTKSPLPEERGRLAGGNCFYGLEGVVRVVKEGLAFGRLFVGQPACVARLELGAEFRRVADVVAITALVCE